MALKIMTTSCISSKVDRQYFDDNMLTDEDFHFESDDFLEIKLNGNMDTFEKFANEIRADLHHQNVTNEDAQSLDFVESLNFGSNLDDLLQNCLNEDEMGSSPYPNGLPSPENNMSVISIPDDDSNGGVNGLITDTPPLTPPNIMETISSSPPNCSPLNPIIVSVRTVPTVTYLVPPAQQQPMKLQLNIQPKPVCTELKEPTIISKEVLDQESVINLTNRFFGVQEQVMKVPRTVSSNISSQSHPIKSTSGRNGSRKSDVVDACTAALKRQERIIKNRESAYLSRKRKKEYVTNLEEKLNEMATENTSLREENCRLKSRISNLEKEILTLKAAFSSKGMKKTVCFMVVFCMITFNFASYGSLFQRIQFMKTPLKTNIANHRIGRTLLWSVENDTKEFNATKLLRTKKFIKEEDESPYVMTWDGSYNLSTCQQYINKSESLRLENDLLGWVKRVEKKQKLKENKLKKNVVDLKKNVPPPLPKLQQLGARYRHENQKDIWAKRKSRNEILIYQTPRKDYEDFFDAIHRRDDSFYFISFSGDHLLLPAIAHNQTQRPKMSFVMPAMILNDSVGDSTDHISMMQIDCEVLDTKLVYIKESVIPPHLRQKHNSSTKASSKNESRFHGNKNSNRIHGTTIKLTNHTSGHG